MATVEPDTPAAPLGGRFEDGEHVYPLRVYHEDTDAGGIVYYANYLKFAERARTELMRGAGITHVTLLGDHDAAFVVRRCVVDYRQPARARRRNRGAHDHRQGGGCAYRRRAARRARRGSAGHGRPQARCVGRNGRAVRLPTPLRHALSELVSADQR